MRCWSNAMSSRMSKANVGIYCPFALASFGDHRIDPDTHSLHSLVRDDRLRAPVHTNLRRSLRMTGGSQ
jgi:hypothetical protein